MVWLLKSVLACALLSAWWPASARSQEPPSTEDSVQILSGIVEEVDGSRIVVNRAVLGKPAELRTFMITGETKVEGRLRQGARVTVGYRSSESGDVAIRIIVRSQAGQQQGR